ncbi:MAG TPA: ACT domain-containing protein [Longimicrobium sp.]|nr:ACT domain-containing protein [Longimicrobium sp.]
MPATLPPVPASRADATAPPLTLTLLADTFAVCRLDGGAVVPEWAWTGEVACVTRTRDELSIVCKADLVPEEVRRESGWRCLKVKGPLDFSLTGVFARIAQPLADAGISLFAVMTYDTDYVMVKQERLRDAADALMAAGHVVQARVGD